MYTREQCYHISFVTNPILCALVSYWILDWLWIRLYWDYTFIYDLASSFGISHAMSGFLDQHAIPLLSAAVLTTVFTIRFWRSRGYGQ
ncbi:hypothetical protein [Azospirillum brasilense]|uniref:hypothetical protein n=1 Tax=Azospirillum brasilense TaxID=192 RepID=UPI000E69C27D|nr:hypothetical protein [Azospirillum brasilense]NUB24723.1 hypothetical protein [Azospirillum brasilense]NUB30673.1 hypothetical protein [Azospirillum brasilense]RIW08283.1 hypothetical protein D2T81_00800 [Azospirillum brasilense]